MAFFRTAKQEVALRLVFLLACVAAALVQMPGQAEGAEVRAFVKAPKVRPNQVFAFIVEIEGGAPDAYPDLRLPLQIGQSTAMNRSQELQIVNGQRRLVNRLVWGLTASEPGDFVIPAQNIQVGGQTLTTNDVKLTVEQGGDPNRDPLEGNKPLLQMELAKTSIYQGEVMPVVCKLYFPRMLPLLRRGLIEIEKSDFAIARFPQQFEQELTEIDGVGYVVLIYRSTLSSLRTGDLKVGPASMEITVEVPAEGGAVPNALQQDFFGMRVERTEPRKVVLKSPPVNLKVLPLPAEGKPASFSGAVGDFALTATATPTELTVGDPIAVELNVEGRGNFDALLTPKLSQESGWKIYPAKRYTIEGQLDQNQVPTLERRIGFSQVMIPEAVHKDLPPFELSFFSPEQKKYVTLRTDAIPLTMKPGAPTPVSTDGAATAGAELVPPPPATDPRAEISDIVINPPPSARWVSLASPLLVRQPKFWYLQAVPVALLILAVAWTLVRRQRESRSGGRAGELRAAWAALEHPRAGDDAEFLRQAAQFIQTAKAGDPVAEEDLKMVLERYQTSNFTGRKPEPLTAAERKKVQGSLHQLYRRALSQTAVILLLLAGSLMMPAGGWAQATAKAAASPDETYREAVTELEKGNFAKAQYLAESLTKKKPPLLSPEIFQLVGHARYKQDDMGRAVLWYERAQLLDGRSPELKQNLRHLSEKLRYITFKPHTPLQEWSLLLTQNEWTVAAAVGGWLVVLALAWRIWRGSRGTVLAVVAGILGLAVAIPSGALASARPKTSSRVRDISLITSPDASVYTAATVTAGSVIDLPPGSQVRILKKRGPWNYVEVEDTSGESLEMLRGWVEASAVTALWPWDEELIP